MNRELAFWLKNGIPPGYLKVLRKQADELDEEAKQKGAELDRRWGAERKGLRSLGDRRAEACGVCLVECAKGAEARLEANARAMGKELRELEERIATEVPLKPVEIPIFDRTTAKGIGTF